ncbi:hypothetical protein AHAS_Ahas11G0174900 [Arachis hypogaea]
MQTLIGQDHQRLDSKVIAQPIFTMEKIDPTITLRVLQVFVENHLVYKASYRKIWLAKTPNAPTSNTIANTPETEIKAVM